jgi:glycosyltransferase involved in cell wall biosynthesis
LNVVYVGTLPPHPGGSAMVGGDLVRGLAAMGHAVRALAPFTAAANRGGDRFAEQNPAVEVRRFLMPYFESAPNVSPDDAYRRREGRLLRARLDDMIRADRPDVVVIGRETFAWHVPDLAARYGIRCALLAQGATTAGMIAGTIPSAAARRYIEQFHRVDLVVLVARHLLPLYRAWGLARLRIVQNGVDRRTFAPRPKSADLRSELGLRPSDVVLLHASNLKSIKRPLDLVESATFAVRRDPRLVYVIAGDGPMRAAIDTACRRRGIARSFRFAGWVDRERMPDLLNLADIVAMPSETEALALLYLETLACGRVLLASDIAGAREVVRDGRDGVLFARGDVGALTDKTLELAARPSLRAAIGRRGRERSRRFDLRRTLSSYEALLAEIAAPKAAARRVNTGNQPAIAERRARR